MNDWTCSAPKMNRTPSAQNATEGISDATGIMQTSILRTGMFSYYPQFETEKLQINGFPFVIASFVFQGIPFEIFAQPLATVHQNASRHLLAEDRILEFGGQKSYQKDGSKRKSKRSSCAGWP